MIVDMYKQKIKYISLTLSSHDLNTSGEVNLNLSAESHLEADEIKQMREEKDSLMKQVQFYEN